LPGVTDWVPMEQRIPSYAPNARKRFPPDCAAPHGNTGVRVSRYSEEESLIREKTARLARAGGIASVLLSSRADETVHRA